MNFSTPSVTVKLTQLISNLVCFGVPPSQCEHHMYKPPKGERGGKRAEMGAAVTAYSAFAQGYTMDYKADRVMFCYKISLLTLINLGKSLWLYCL